MKRVHPINVDHDPMRRQGCGQDRNNAGKTPKIHFKIKLWSGEEILRPENKTFIAQASS